MGISVKRKRDTLEKDRKEDQSLISCFTLSPCTLSPSSVLRKVQS